MQNTTQLRNNPGKQVQVHESGIPREDERILATVPRRTKDERHKENEPYPELYGTARKAINRTPEIESRQNYVAESLIVTTFGGWLASNVIQSRTWAVITDLVLLFVGAAFAGIVLGVMLGEQVLSPTLAPFLVFVIFSIVIILIGCVVGDLLFLADRDSRIHRIALQAGAL